MIEYEAKQSDHSDENLILEKKDKLEIQRLKNELDSEIKLKNMAISTKKSQIEENVRLKAQLDKLQDLIKVGKIQEAEQEKHLKDLQAELETSRKNLRKAEINVNRLNEEHKIGGNYGQGEGRSYDELKSRNSELEREVKRLQSM